MLLLANETGLLLAKIRTCNREFTHGYYLNVFI